MPDDTTQVAEPGPGVAADPAQPTPLQVETAIQEFLDTDPTKRDAWQRHAMDVQNYIQYCKGATSAARKKWAEHHLRWQGDKSKILSQLNEIQKKWRAKIQVSTDYSAILVLLARMCGIIRETDPPVQAVAVGPEDTQDEAIQRCLSYVIRSNNKNAFWFRLLKNVAIQGWQPVKLTWESSIQRVEIPNDDEAMIEWQEGLSMAQELSGLPPEQFLEIAKDAMKLEGLFQDLKASRGFVPPTPPRMVDGQLAPQQHDVIKALGPRLSVPSPWDVYADPKIVDPQDQRVIVHELRVPHQWLVDNTGPKGEINPKTNLPYRFSPQAVKLAGTGGLTIEGVRTEEDTLRAQAGVSSGTSGATSNPYAPQYDLLWEVWQPGSKEFGFTVILNQRGKPINHPDDQGNWPFCYEHGEQPWFWVTMNPDSFDMLGMSEYDRTIDLLREADTIRSLRIDAILLHMMGVWERKGGWMAGSGQLSPVPGETWNVQDFGEMKNLFDHIGPELIAGMREQDYINAEHDAALGTGGNVRGAEATVSRVTGSEQQARLERADERILLRLGLVESSLMKMPRQALFLLLQFARKQPIAQRMLANVSGLPVFPWGRVVNALSQDYQLAFTTGRKDKGLMAQQAMGWVKDIGLWLLQNGIIGIEGFAEAARQTAAASGLTNQAKILAPPPPPPPPPEEGDGGGAPEGGGGAPEGEGNNQPPEGNGPA